MPELPTIAYLGPQATFTHQAAVKAFGPEARYQPAEAVDGVFAAVEEGRADRGVVPIENSNEGMVTSTLDLLADSPLVIAGEVVLPVRLMLFSHEGSLGSVRQVHSHPQALAQARRWLRANLPDARLLEAPSTAEALSRCRPGNGAAAVAGEMAGPVHGVPLLRADVGDWEENLTRFLVVARQGCPATGHDKTSLLLTIKDRVGALYEILRPFGERGINLTRIESRPSRRKAWDYVFFLDFDGHREDPIVRETLRKVAEMCVELRVLGSYPKQSAKAAD